MPFLSNFTERKTILNTHDMENQYTTTPPTPQMDIPTRPKSWLVESILVTIFCCLPFGIVGIVNAARVNSLYDQGLYEEALNVSSKAKKWSKFGLIAGLIYLVFIIVMISMGWFTGTSMPGAEGLTF